MRIEEYRRELTGEGYRIVGTKNDYNYHSNYYGDPIKMSLTLRDGIRCCDNLDELICVAKVGLIEEDSGFEEIYREVLRGDYSVWQLGEVTVYPGGIILGYGGGRFDSPEEALIYIQGIDLALTFETPSAQLGLNPTYDVLIRHNHDGTHLFTRVDENLGYMHRTIYFKLKDPTKMEQPVPANNQVIHVIEYIGM